MSSWRPTAASAAATYSAARYGAERLLPGEGLSDKPLTTVAAGNVPDATSPWRPASGKGKPIELPSSGRRRRRRRAVVEFAFFRHVASASAAARTRVGIARRRGARIEGSDAPRALANTAPGGGCRRRKSVKRSSRNRGGAARVAGAARTQRPARMTIASRGTDAHPRAAETRFGEAKADLTQKADELERRTATKRVPREHEPRAAHAAQFVAPSSRSCWRTTRDGT